MNLNLKALPHPFIRMWCTCMSRSASDASLPKTEEEIAADGDPTKTQPVKNPPAVLSKAIELIHAPDENWYESRSIIFVLKRRLGSAAARNSFNLLLTLIHFDFVDSKDLSLK